MWLRWFDRYNRSFECTKSPRSVLETDLLILPAPIPYTYTHSLCASFFFSLVSTAGLWAPKPSDLLFHFAGHGHQLHPVAGLSGLVMKCTWKNRERCLNTDSGKPKNFVGSFSSLHFLLKKDHPNDTGHLYTSPNGLRRRFFNFDRGTKAMCRGWKANESAPSVRQVAADLFFTHKRAARCRGLPIF